MMNNKIDNKIEELALNIITGVHDYHQLTDDKEELEEFENLICAWQEEEDDDKLDGLLTDMEKLVSEIIGGKFKAFHHYIERESMSYGDIVELQSLSDFIDDDDKILLQWAGKKE